MSKRHEIINPAEWDRTKTYGLVYSEILGWIDIGHAQGDDIKNLLNSFMIGEASNNEYYKVTYSQKMHINNRRFGTGKFIEWEIKKGRKLNEIHSIALSMMLTTARLFESYQSQWFFNWYTDSGFSGEDLTSDLLGFYRAIIPTNYQTILNLVSKDNALNRWDYYGSIGNWKNDGFSPLLFPDPANPCIKHIPYKSKLPSFLTWIRPYSNFGNDIVRVLKKDGTYFSFNL